MNISLLDKVGDFDDSIIENIKFAFIHKGLLLNSVNIEGNESEECEEIDDGGADNNLTSEKNQIKIENNKKKNMTIIIIYSMEMYY